MKIFALSGIFNPDLCKFWIFFALFTLLNVVFLNFHTVVFLHALTGL